MALVLCEIIETISLFRGEQFKVKSSESERRILTHAVIIDPDLKAL